MVPLQVLHSLGGWPEGLWYRTDAAGQPRGALIWVQLRGATLHVIQIDHAGNLAARFCRIDLGASAVSPPDLSLALRIMVTCSVMSMELPSTHTYTNGHTLGEHGACASTRS